MTRNRFLLLIGVIILVAFSLTIFIYFYRKHPRSPDVSEVSTKKNQSPDVLRENKGNEPVLSLTSEKPDLMTLVWQNLPPAASYIEILRSSSFAGDWQKWQTIYINKNINGSAEIKNNHSEQNSNFYNYQIQAVSEGGIVLAENKINSTASNNAVVVVSGVQTPASTSNSYQASTSENNLGNSNNNNSNTSSNNPDHFEVKYVNKKIEIKWWNLPSNVSKAIVYRSMDLNNWLILLEQQNPELIGPYSISLVDHTFQDSYYYKLSVGTSNEVVAVYGPAFLGPFGL